MQEKVIEEKLPEFYETAQVNSLTEIQVIAKNIDAGLKAFEERKIELTKLRDKVSGLVIESIEDKVAIAEVSTARKTLKKARVELQKEGKFMRDPLTRIAKTISAKEDELIDIISPTEKDLQSKEDWVKAEQDKIDQAEARRKQELIQARIDKLRAYGFEIDLTFITALGDEDFEKVLDNARVEYEKGEAIKVEEARLEQEMKAQILKDQEELKALREKQEKADRIIREREAEVSKREAEQKKREEEDAIIAARQKEDAMKKARFEPRKEQLLGMGFKQIAGVDFSLADTWSTYWEQVFNMSDEEWPLYIIDIEDAVERRKVRIAAEEKKRVDDLELARLKGISDEQERLRQAEVKKKEELEKAGDKAVWADFISKLKALPVPSMNSSQYRRMAGATRKMLIDIYDLKP